MDKTHHATVQMRRDHDQIFLFNRSCNVNCLWALILILLSIVLYLDRTVHLEPPQQYGWNKDEFLDRDHQWGLPQSIPEAQTSDSGSTRFASGRRFSNGALSQAKSMAADNGDAVQVKHQAPTVKAAAAVGSGANAKGALHGMGITFRKGSRAMKELVVAHLDDATTSATFRIFLRSLHRSGVTSRADIVLIFPSGSAAKFSIVLHEEERSFRRLMLQEQATAPIHKLKTRKQNSSKKTKTEYTPRLRTAHTNVDTVIRPSTSPISRGRHLKNIGTSRTTLSHASTNLQTSGTGPAHDPSSASEVGAEGDPMRLISSSSESTSLLNCSPSGTVNLYRNLKTPNVSINSFNVPAFWKSREESIQHKGRRSGNIIWETTEQSFVSDGSPPGSDEKTSAVTWGDWGSIAGFDVEDLERDDGISGFVDEPPVRLRRWMCYRMLLGMVKRHYRTVLLTEVRGVVILGDVLSMTREATSSSNVYLFEEDRTWKEAHCVRTFRTEEKATQSATTKQKDYYRKPLQDLETAQNRIISETRARPSCVQTCSYDSAGVGGPEPSHIRDVYGEDIWQKLEDIDRGNVLLSSGVVMGNLKLIQILSNAMVTEIVRVAAILRKSRTPFHDQPLLNYLILKSGILSKKLTEKLHLVTNGASTVHTLPRSKQKSVFFRDEGGMFHLLQGLSHESIPEEMRSLIIKSIQTDICSSLAGLSAYGNCSLPEPSEA